MTPPTQPVWYSLLVAFAGALLIAAVSVVVSVWLATRTAQESERKWCAVVSTLDDAYTATPPQTDLGRDIARKMHQLRAALGCP